MKNIIFASKLGLLTKLSLLAILAAFTFSAHAEYFVVVSAPCVGCCVSGCGTVVKKVYVRHFRPVHHVFRPVHRCGVTSCAYRSCSTCFSGCGGCVRPVFHSAWVRGHWNCFGQWVPGHWRNYYYQTNFGYPNMIYDPDLTTGDDNPMVDPDMDIDR